MMKRKNKAKREEKNMCTYIKKLPDSLDALGISRGFKIKTHTHLSNHMQSGNEDFVCASESFFAICTCPLI
jgi:hypothetical protein